MSLGKREEARKDDEDVLNVCVKAEVFIFFLYPFIHFLLHS